MHHPELHHKVRRNKKIYIIILWQQQRQIENNSYCGPCVRMCVSTEAPAVSLHMHNTFLTCLDWILFLESGFSGYTNISTIMGLIIKVGFGKKLLAKGDTWCHSCSCLLSK